RLAVDQQPADVGERPAGGVRGDPLPLALLPLLDRRLADLAPQPRGGDPRFRERLHLPVHTGSRFSKNARTPSWMSSVENASVRLWCRKSSASASGMSIWRNIASLPSRMITGDFFASAPAHSATAASRSASGTTRLTIP